MHPGVLPYRDPVRGCDEGAEALDGWGQASGGAAMVVSVSAATWVGAAARAIAGGLAPFLSHPRIT